MNAQTTRSLWADSPALNRAAAARLLADDADADQDTHHVVLLHASGSSARQWAQATDVLEAHPARFRVHTLNLHGHGAQPAWQGEAPLTLAHEAALVEPLLQRLGGAHVVGHSYGGAVALKLACCRPGLVKSLVAFEPVLMRLLQDGGANSPEARVVFAATDVMRQALVAGQSHTAARTFIDFWSGRGSWQTLGADRQQAMALRVPVLLQQFGALFGDSMDAGRLARLRMPLLLLSGERTVDTARALVRRLRAALPYARHEVLPEMGHMGPVTHAAAFNRRIADFLVEQVANGDHTSAQADLHDSQPLARAVMPELLPPDFFRTLLS